MGGGWHGANPDLTLAIKWPYDQSESLGLEPELTQHTKALPFNDVEGSSTSSTRPRRISLASFLRPSLVRADSFLRQRNISACFIQKPKSVGPS